MTEKIELDFEPWDDHKDYPLTVSHIAHVKSADNGRLSDMTVAHGRKRRNEEIIQKSEAEVVALVAGGLEWLRWRGYSAGEVQSKVKSYIQGNKDRRDQQAIRTTPVLKAINDYSNPKKRKVADTVVIG